MPELPRWYFPISRFVIRPLSTWAAPLFPPEGMHGRTAPPRPACAGRCTPGTKPASRAGSLAKVRGIVRPLGRSLGQRKRRKRKIAPPMSCTNARSCVLRRRPSPRANGGCGRNDIGTRLPRTASLSVRPRAVNPRESPVSSRAPPVRHAMRAQDVAEKAVVGTRNEAVPDGRRGLRASARDHPRHIVRRLPPPAYPPRGAPRCRPPRRARGARARSGWRASSTPCGRGRPPSRRWTRRSGD